MNQTKEQLLFMMQRYEIGKKPLAKLLGWGDTTVMRYLSGAEPNREFAARIESLAENPWEYARVLEQNREKLTDTAYRKTRRAVYREIFCDRSTEAMQYIVALSDGDIAPYRVVMVLYYAQVCSVTLRGLPLFEEEADFSTEQTCVYPMLYRLMRQYGIRRISSDISSFSAEEQTYLEQTYQVLNGYSPNALKALYVREKRRIRRHLHQEADRISPEKLKNQYELLFHKMEVTQPLELKHYLNAELRS